MPKKRRPRRMRKRTKLLLSRLNKIENKMLKIMNDTPTNESFLTDEFRSLDKKRIKIYEGDKK